MSITVEQLKTKLIDKLAATHVEIEDVSDGCGAKFVAKIVSSKFDGLSLLEQHRLVNEAIADEMNLIHSFRMKTMTPEKFAAESSK
ncbi:bolA-like protein 2 [Dermatophagoides pteronyssinus]|uniref:BolA-like protein 2 n=2 Tax=Dermatophagoides pteronyssinus TaxID=6956 RepID=A0A6P6Y8L6_DERPT|nr:bolA-like protein 2 [Dermatophagoides pteronyssinus]KAH9424518.1 regulation of transcription by RNA polymerase II [Dermatophagoides pteronyssinus]